MRKEGNAMTKVLMLLTGLLLLTGCAAGEKNASYLQVSAQEAVRMMGEEEGYIILDVRTQAEYEEGHIPGAVCIPNEEIGTERPEGLTDPAQRIFVYCRSGNRSKKAAQKLADMGYTAIVEMGGILDWPGETTGE